MSLLEDARNIQRKDPAARNDWKSFCSTPVSIFWCITG